MIKITILVGGKEARTTRRAWLDKLHKFFNLLFRDVGNHSCNVLIKYVLHCFMQYELPFYYPGQVSN